MRVSPEDPSWTAPRTGFDWRDDIVLLATAWLSDLADRRTWQNRIATTRDRSLAAKERWAEGEQTPLYDPSDTSAWYVFQASAYASDRMDWVPNEAVRMVPTFTRVGNELTMLINMPGAEARAARLMNADRGQPDGGLFELLVALAYRRNGWETEFVPERQASRARTTLTSKRVVGPGRLSASGWTDRATKRARRHVAQSWLDRSMSSPSPRAGPSLCRSRSTLSLTRFLTTTFRAAPSLILKAPSRVSGRTGRVWAQFARSTGRLVARYLPWTTYTMAPVG